jgi:hypothetical protein
MGFKGFGPASRKGSDSGGVGGKGFVAAATESKASSSSSSSSSFFLNSNPEIAKISVGAHIPAINLEYPGLRAVYGDPPVFEIDSVFTPEVCQSYIERASVKGKKVNSATFNAQLSGSVRTSTTWYLRFAEVPELIQVAESLTGYPSSHFEEPQIVRYEMGQQFSWHGDSIPKSVQQEQGENGGGNRLATFIVYLNSLPTSAGGATAFKDLRIRCQPEQGKGLLFFPCYQDGSSDDRTFHCGQVAMETKWIAQIWVHECPVKR